MHETLLPRQSLPKAYSIFASEEFIQHHDIVRELRNEHHFILLERTLPDGEDLILDPYSCVVFLNSKDIPKTSENEEMDLRIISKNYAKCWVILQINPQTDKQLLLSPHIVLTPQIAALAWNKGYIKAYQRPKT